MTGRFFNFYKTAGSNYSIKYERTSMTGRVIVVDGVDGSGKGLQVDQLMAGLRDEIGKDRPVSQTHEPYDVAENTIGMAIRTILEHRETRPPNAAAFQYIFYLDRVVHWETDLGPSRKAGEIKVSDRERMVTYAHGVAGGVPLEMMLEWHKNLPVADLYIYLRVSAETALERLTKKNTASGKRPDYFEDEEKVRKNVEAFDNIASWGIIPNLVTVDGNPSPERVHLSIWNKVVPILNSL